HAQFVSSTPANGTVTQRGLTQITITFTEEISVEHSHAQVLKPDGPPMQGVKTVVALTGRKKMTITTPPLGDGPYQVRWFAVTDQDNGATAGIIWFVVGPAACATFPETGEKVCGTFLAYWYGHGGLAQQGYPISGEMQERSDTDGKAYTVQYF